MSNQSSAKYKSVSSGFFSGSPTRDPPELPPGKLLMRLQTTDIMPPENSAKISKFKSIASYNWLDSSKPIMLVPGSPAIWSPPAHRRKLEPDKGELFIDQNAARWSRFPLEPMFRALYEMNPTFTFTNQDVIICRNTMAKLYAFVTMTSKSFEIDVEAVGRKVLFIRKEKQATEFISEFRGFGHTFPDEYTRWDPTVKSSSSHYRIAECEFASLKYLIRYECDAYIQERDGLSTQGTSWRQEGVKDPSSTASLLTSGTSFTVGEKKPVLDRTLEVRKAGSQVDQGATLEIKTRAAHKILDMESVLPRLWMSQTPNLVAAYHRGGRFDDIRRFDVRKDIERWEEKNSTNLQKLDAIIRRIIDTVGDTKSQKCRVRVNDNGEMEIWELDLNY